MTDLISRLQAATGSNRELDAEVALANGFTKEHREDLQGPYIRWRGPNGWNSPDPPRYTESIDAALMLVKTDCWWQLIHYSNGSCEAMVVDSNRSWLGKGSTPALALLIAIERAKENSKP